MEKRDVVIGSIIVIVLIVLAIILINVFRGNVSKAGEEFGVELYNAPSEDDDSYMCKGEGYGKGYGDSCEKDVVVKDDNTGALSLKKEKFDCGPCLVCGKETKNRLSEWNLHSQDPVPSFSAGVVMYELVCKWIASEGEEGMECDDNCKDGKKVDSKSRCINIIPNMPEMDCRRIECNDNSDCDICKKCVDDPNDNFNFKVCESMGIGGYEDDIIPAGPGLGEFEEVRCSGRYVNDEIADENNPNNKYSCKNGDCEIKV
ncbi:hypothetical protein GOV12_01600 [Candidatus Pacearchaeota archaeon]|nr:hypothetical protein [Candidatus Pacearchaeota archaeon]